MDINRPGRLENINAQEFAAKFNSKREVYRFLASEVKAYLPSYETVSIYHVSTSLSTMTFLLILVKRSCSIKKKDHQESRLQASYLAKL